MTSTMVVIKFEKGLLHLAAVRQGIAYLMEQNVSRFNDGKYHIALSLESFKNLLSAFSEHDARESGFEAIADGQSVKYQFAGFRWEIDPKVSGLKIFGPKSNPDNPYVIDLTQPVEAGDGE